MRFLLFSFWMFCPFILLSQMWENVTADHSISHQISPPGEYGAGVSFYDVNRDGWDDLTLCNNGTDIFLYLNNEGVFDAPVSIVENSEEAKHVTWADFDNDGDPDLFLTSYNAPFRLFENDGNLNLTEITSEAGLPTTFDLTFGHCWGDYDRDGFIDLYVCNYNGAVVTNYLFKNNGDGTFDDVTNELNASDGSCHSFQPAFLDVNNDLWPDIFIANDRENCRNTLLLNEEGYFSDVTEAYGLADYMFAMNNTAADYDHDGDLDIYITNNPFGNRFKRNNGNGTFSEIASQLGLLLNDHSWSAQWVDIDNDTWEDLHVCVSPFWGQPGQNRFFLNNGVTFDDMTYAAGLINDEAWSHSSATGDFNNDGFPDILVVNDIPDWSQLFTSIPTENNYIKVLLTGTVSNRDGIGSWIDLYSANTHQRKFTQCGEGYLSQNSRTELFGLAQAEIVDSLIISWPSGVIDKWYNLEINGLVELTEGYSDSAVVGYESLILCQNTDLLLTASADPEDMVIWSNGHEDDSLYVDEPGDYWFELTNSFGLTFFSDTVTIDVSDSLAISFEPIQSYCAHLIDGSILTNLQGSAGVAEIQWNNEPTEALNLDPAISGWNYLELTTTQGCIYQDSAYIETPDSLQFDFNVNHPLCSPYGSVDFEISGGAGGYVLNWGNLNPAEAVGGIYDVSLSDMAGCVLDTVIQVDQGPNPLVAWVLNVIDAENGPNGSAELLISGGTPPFSVIWQPIGIMDELEVDGLAQGTYTVVVTDANGCIDEAEFTIIDTRIPELQLPKSLPFPNPFKEHFTVETSGLTQYLVTLYSITGQKVLQHWCNGPSCVIHAPDLPSGIYSIRMQDENGKLVGKGIISKE